MSFFRNFSDFMRACATHKHLGQSFRHLLFVATITVKELGMELPLTVSGYFECDFPMSMAL
jgi:hypothetical protein